MSGFFAPICGKYGHESGLVQRKSRLTASKLAQALILGSLKMPEATLCQYRQVLDDLGVEISESGLHQRLNHKAVEFMKRLTQYALDNWYEQERIEVEMLRRFPAVRLVDSSQIKLPDALADVFPGTTPTRAKASLKVSLSYEFLSGRFEAVCLEAGKRPDQNNPILTQGGDAGSLTLCDLGFFNQTAFDELHQQGAYFLSRLKSQAGFYESIESRCALDLPRLLPTGVGAKGELTGYLGSEKRIPVRLIYERLPDVVVAQRRRKARAAKRRQGKTCTQRVLDLLQWTLYVTNLPPSLATDDEICTLYRLRWQIELVFKLWKSYGKLDRIGKWRRERILCQFYARLLALLLFQWLAMSHRRQHNRELSLPAALQCLQGKAHLLIDAVSQGADAIARVIHRIEADFRRFALKQKRRKYLSTLDLLVQLTEP